MANPRLLGVVKNPEGRSVAGATATLLPRSTRRTTRKPVDVMVTDGIATHVTLVLPPVPASERSRGQPAGNAGKE